MTEQQEFTLTTGDVAKQLQVNIDSVSRWADQKKIACWKTPGGWRRFRQADVDAFRSALKSEAAS